MMHLACLSIYFCPGRAPRNRCSPQISDRYCTEYDSDPLGDSLAPGLSIYGVSNSIKLENFAITEELDSYLTPWMSLACWIVTYMPSLRLDFSVMDTVYTIPPRTRHLSIFRRELSTEILLIMGQRILVILGCWIYRSNHVIDFEWTISSLYWDAYSVQLTPCIPGWRRIAGSGIYFLFGFSVTLLGTAVSI